MNLWRYIFNLFKPTPSQLPEARGKGQQSIAAALPVNGRSSAEEPVEILTGMSSFMDMFDGISPVIPFDYLEFLTKVAIVNPDLSHAIKNWVNLANNGHNLIVESGSDRVVDAAQARLNEKAATLYQRSGGVDGLINHYLYDLAVSGAISSEDIIQPDMKGVERVAIVPARKIRFRFEDDNYVPYQRLVNGNMLPLNGNTFRYFAYQVIENSPYAKPPIVAAIEPILRQQDMFENVKFIMKKFGLLGLVAMSLTARPRQPNESEQEWRRRNEAYAADVLSAINKNFNKGLMVKFSDQELQHFNIAGNAQGADAIMRQNEEQVASGIGVDTSMLGRSYSSTETFANVTYMFMVRDANNLRRLVKRRMERTYELDLLLSGIPVDDIALDFADNPARDPQSEAQANQIHQKNVLEKVRTGLIDPDTGAQELGYNEWFDPELINSGETQNFLFSKRTADQRLVRLHYDKNFNKYRFSRQRIVLQGQQKTDEKPPRTFRLASDKDVRKKLEALADDYLNAVLPHLGIAREAAIEDIVRFLRRSNYADFRDAGDFSDAVYLYLLERYPDAFTTAAAKKAVVDNVTSIYTFYRTEDLSAWGTAPGINFALDHLDNRTLSFVEGLDRFYLSKFISNSSTENQLFKFLEDQFLEKGEGLFGRTSPDTVSDFIGLLDDKLKGNEEIAAKRIINTGVQRMRNWAHIGQLDQAEIQYAEVFNASPQADICIYMNGKIIAVGVARQAVERLTSMTHEEFENWLQPVSKEQFKQSGIPAQVAEGRGFPPYHPYCHTRLVAAADATAASEQSRAATWWETWRLMGDAHAPKNGSGSPIAKTITQESLNGVCSH